MYKITFWFRWSIILHHSIKIWNYITIKRNQIKFCMLLRFTCYYSQWKKLLQFNGREQLPIVAESDYATYVENKTTSWQCPARQRDADWGNTFPIKKVTNPDVHSEDVIVTHWTALGAFIWFIDPHYSNLLQWPRGQWSDPTQTARFMGPTWGPPGSCRGPHVGPHKPCYQGIDGYVDNWLVQRNHSRYLYHCG